MSGRLFVIEGLDGSGKTTQLEILRNCLEGKGYGVVLIKEPINSETGKKIRRAIDGKIEMSEADFQDLFIQNRRELLRDVIEPVIRLGGTVILDRYYWATIAYGTSRGLDFDELMRKNFTFRTPDITFFLDVSPLICVERMDLRGDKKTRFENEEKMTAALKEYMKLIRMFSDNIVLINGEQKIDEVSNEIKKILTNRNLI